MDNALLYVASVYESFHDEPKIFDDFLSIAGDVTANRIDGAIGIVTMTQLMKGHENLLQGLSVFFPIAKKMPDVETFVKNVKTRFVSVDSYVYKSVLVTVNMYKDRKKSLMVVCKEVLDLLYYHEDLTEEFSRVFQI